MPPPSLHIIQHVRCQIRVIRTLSIPLRRYYHSPDSPLPQAFPPPQTAILEASLPWIRLYGFSAQTLAQGCAVVGYPPAAATAFFPRGAFELVDFHLTRRRAELQSRWLGGERHLRKTRSDQGGENENDDAESRLRDLILLRLRANLEHGVAGRWNEVRISVLCGAFLLLVCSLALLS